MNTQLSLRVLAFNTNLVRFIHDFENGQRRDRFPFWCTLTQELEKLLEDLEDFYPCIDIGTRLGPQTHTIDEYLKLYWLKCLKASRDLLNRYHFPAISSYQAPPISQPID